MYYLTVKIFYQRQDYDASENYKCTVTITKIFNLFAILHLKIARVRVVSTELNPH